MKKISSFIYLIIFTFSFPVWAQEKNSETTDDNSEQSSLQEVKDKKYVTDQLRLSLYKKASANSGTLKLLTSGDVLGVLERSGPYSKVKTEEGKIGWVKNGFLVSIPPASFLLVEEQEKNKKLSVQLEKYSNTQKIIDDYENTIQKMNADDELIGQELDKIKSEFDQISEINRELKEEIAVYSQNSSHLSWKVIISIIQQYWHILAATLLVLFLIGLLTGKRMVEARVSKRFQGVKVL